MKNTDGLRKRLSRSAQGQLDWAKQFKFLYRDEQQSCDEYDEKALLAYQILVRASNEDIEKILNWFLGKWQCAPICVEKTFGFNPTIEFDNVYEFANHLLNVTLERRPMAICEWVIANFNRGGPYDQVMRTWLDSAFECDSVKACQALIRICAHHSFRLRRGSKEPAKENVLHFLRVWYGKNPGSLTTFFQGIGIGSGAGGHTLRALLNEVTRG